MRALALNAGSSSLKAALYDIETLPPLAEPPDPVQRAEVDAEPGEPAGGTVRRVLERVGGTVDAVGHRVVHGGEHFREPTHVTDEVRSQIDALSASAPLHNAAALDGVAAAEAALGPGVPQVAVFDTAFHASLPPAAYAYAGPYEWLDAGLRRFGFHGINHEYVAHRAARLLDRELADLRLITCHLGSGCSLAAVRGGVSVDTTMGFTPLEGLPMATRSGSVDPGCSCTCCVRRAAPRRRSPSCSTSARAWPAWQAAPATCGRSSPAANAATHGRSLPSTSTSTGCAGRSGKCSQASGAWTPSCSPVASARQLPRSGPRRWSRSPSSASCSIPTTTRRRLTTPTSRMSGPASRCS